MIGPRRGGLALGPGAVVVELALRRVGALLQAAVRRRPRVRELVGGRARSGAAARWPRTVRVAAHRARVVRQVLRVRPRDGGAPGRLERRVHG